VSDVIDSEQSIYPRLWDAFDALKWWLARMPESGELLDDINWLYRQEGNKERNIPSLTTVYEFDHITVVLKFILVRVPCI
jgi:hypothetical protein